MALTTATTCQFQIEPDRRCGRPALRRMRYCYLHQRDHKRNARKLAERARQRWFDSVDTTDRAAVQRAIAEIIRRLALGLIDHDKAAQMIFALQVVTEKLQCAMRKDSGTPCR